MSSPVHRSVESHHQDASSEQAEPAEDDPAEHSDVDVSPKYMWMRSRRTPDGWWEYIYWGPQVHFKLTDARDKELQEEQRQPRRPGVDFSSSLDRGLIIPFLDMLKYARKITVSHFARDLREVSPLMYIGRFLEKEHNPVPALMSLVLHGGTIQDIKPICDAIKSGKLTTLMCLEINDVGFGDAGLGSLVATHRAGILPSLSELSLRNNNIGSDGVSALFQGSFPCLRHLDLGGNIIRGGGHLALSKAMRSGRLLALEYLNLSNTDMEDIDCHTYAQALTSGNLPALKHLNLGFNVIGDHGATTLASACVLPSLSELSLRNNNIGSDGVRALFQGSFPCLRHLDLGDNIIRGDGHLALAKAMGSGRLLALEHLNLSNTDMEDNDCYTYAKGMTSGNLPALKHLNLGFNIIGDSGATTLASACGSGKIKSLTHLGLEYNKIGDRGMIALANSFEVGTVPALTVLSLQCQSNSFTEEGLLVLSRVLTSGQLNSLRSLDLSYNTGILTESCAKALLAALARNNALNCTIEFQWHRFPALDLLKKQLEERNRTTAQILSELGLLVPATFGKVYLCGSPEVGKTTLKNSLRRSFCESLCLWETRPHEEKRTRGIEVSEVASRAKRGDNPIRLAVWDMAGQEEYHMVHNAFFPDLAFANGKATTFIIVCNSRNVDVIKQELNYWLRFIASSCGKSVQSLRKVLVVLNRIRGDSKALEHSEQWKYWLEQQSETFHGYLDIRTRPFIVDVRRRMSVKDLKRYLIDHSRGMLKTEEVPKICLFIQSNLIVWSKEREKFPVLRWEDFVRKVQEKESEWTEKTLEAAAKYLDEAGVLLFIHKELPNQLATPSKKFVVINPNWFCREVVGNMFLPKNMGSPGENVFRLKVDRYNGSISVTELKQFFTPLHREWDSSQMEDFVDILLWLGLCYGDGDQKVFIPALIDQEENAARDLHNWGPRYPPEHVEGQWVMGYSIEHKDSAVTLAPIALWHKFQVKLAKSPEFNDEAGDNDFVVSRYDITFKVNYMNVLIKVDASNASPTFSSIDIFVKPLRPASREIVDPETRKECQVDLASSLAHALLRLWIRICPGVEYVHRVVWPWPASHPRKFIPERNMEVTKVLKFVEENGLGIEMQWTVGSYDTITREQLLSTTESKYALESVRRSLDIAREGMREAVELGTYPVDDDGTEQVPSSISKVDQALGSLESQENSQLAPPSSSLLGTSIESVELEGGFREAIKSKAAEVEEPYPPSGEILTAVRGLEKQIKDLVAGQGVLLDLAKKNLVETKVVRNDLMKVMKAQKDMLQKVQDVGKFLLEDKERSCPRFIYFGKKHSGRWVTLKDAMSPMVKVHLHFLCEAQYDHYGQHQVKDQQGVDVSKFKDWAQKILPWLKVSLTILFISAKVSAYAVAPGLGTIIPDFTRYWNQAMSISEGLVLATGFSKQELDKLSSEEIRPVAKSTPKSPQELQGDIRKAMTEILGKLTAAEYEEKLGLRKVYLHRHGVVWICKECYLKYPKDLVSEL